MEILPWSDQFSVGVEIIDEQHKELVAMVNAAHKFVVEMKEKEVLNDLLGGMREYAFTHFTTEARLMKEHSYPRKDLHRFEHNDFVNTVTQTEQALDTGEDVDPLVLFAYLANWLRDHILGTDMELGEYLTSNGAQ